MNSTLFKASCTWYVWATHFALLERRATVIVAAKLPISTKATAETKASFARLRGSMLIAHSHGSNSGVTLRMKTIARRAGLSLLKHGRKRMGWRLRAAFSTVKLQRPARTHVCSHSRRDKAAIHARISITH